MFANPDTFNYSDGNVSVTVDASWVTVMFVAICIGWVAWVVYRNTAKRRRKK